MTPDLAAAIHHYTAGVKRARRAYYADSTDDQLAAARAKADRKAAAQARYRDRLKESKK